jgi:hypothetical protein
LPVWDKKKKEGNLGVRGDGILGGVVKEGAALINTLKFTFAFLSSSHKAS